MLEKSAYYPIALTYKGIAPDDPERPDFINKSFVVKFNPIKKIYEESSFALLFNKNPYHLVGAFIKGFFSTSYIFSEV